MPRSSVWKRLCCNPSPADSSPIAYRLLLCPHRVLHPPLGAATAMTWQPRESEGSAIVRSASTRATGAAAHLRTFDGRDHSEALSYSIIRVAATGARTPGDAAAAARCGGAGIPAPMGIALKFKRQRTIGYLRVITKNQAAQRNGLASQGDAIEKYCEASNFELLARPEGVPAPGGSRWHYSTVALRLTARGCGRMKVRRDGRGRRLQPKFKWVTAMATASASWCQAIRSPGQIGTARSSTWVATSTTSCSSAPGAPTTDTTPLTNSPTNRCPRGVAAARTGELAPTVPTPVACVTLA